MKGKMIIISPRGEIAAQDFNEHISLKTLQHAVGGYIEAVPYFNSYNGEKCVAFTNEEGKLVGLSPNRAATTLWYQQLMEKFPNLDSNEFGDFLVGNLVIVYGDQEFMDSL